MSDKNDPKTHEKPAARTPPRLLEVVRTENISPSLQRITLGGAALHGFPENRKGAHIKVFLPRPHQSLPQLPQLTAQGIQWPEANERPITRTYSVREYLPAQNELKIDFVLHGAHSPASGWALKAKVGDFLGIAGPGGPDPLLSTADWHLLAGDMTALPAISALLEELPTHARGFAFIEIDHAEDQHHLINNSEVVVRWVVRDHQNKKTIGDKTISTAKNEISKEILLEEIKLIAPPIGITSISAFIAGENSAVVSIRDYLREDYGLKKSNLYAVPYWRSGQDEETYHKQRHEIMDQVY